MLLRCFFVCLLTAFFCSADASWQSVSLAPAYFHVDLDNSTAPRRDADFGGGVVSWRYDAASGYLLRPYAAAGWGQGSLYRAGVWIGRHYMLTPCWSLTPGVGYTFTYVESGSGLQAFSVKECVKGHTPYLGVEVCCQPLSCLALIGRLYYGRSCLSMQFSAFPASKFSTEGINGGIAAEFSIRDPWVVGLAYDYESALYEHRRGIRIQRLSTSVSYGF